MTVAIRKWRFLPHEGEKGVRERVLPFSELEKNGISFARCVAG